MDPEFKDLIIHGRKKYALLMSAQSIEPFLEREMKHYRNK